MDRDNTIARLENIAKHAVHTAGEDTFILSLDDGLAIHEAIEALKAQLTHEGTTSDLISRTETVKQLQGALDVTVPITDYDGGFIDGVEVGVSTVSTMPPAQHERKRGKWLADNRPGGGFWVCSCCKFPSEAFAANVLYKFCPNCGAKMKGEPNERSD